MVEISEIVPDFLYLSDFAAASSKAVLRGFGIGSGFPQVRPAIFLLHFYFFFLSEKRSFFSAGTELRAILTLVWYHACGELFLL